MHQPSRRQFVFGVAAATPALLVFNAPLLAQKPGATTSGSDPVLDAMIEELNAARADGDAKPENRKAAMRAAEAIFGTMAVHIEKHYDQTLKASIKKLSRTQRQSLVQDVVLKHNNASHQAVEEVLKLLQNDGAKGIVKQAQKTLKQMRESAPDPIMVVKRRQNYCEMASREISHVEWAADLACLLAIIFPASAAMCVGLMTQALLMRATYYWYC